MKASPQVYEVLTSLEDRLQVSLLLLQNKLSGQRATEEIEAEVTTLHELVDDFSQLDRRLEKLLDPATPTAEIRQIVEQLPDPAKRVAENLNELTHVHSVSHQLIARSVSLVTRAQRLIDQSKNQSSRYALEVCGFCEGFGRTEDSSCPACKGKRSVLVHQPGIKCPRCKGTGRPDSSEPSVRCYRMCTVCLGSGWALNQVTREQQQ